MRHHDIFVRGLGLSLGTLSITKAHVAGQVDHGTIAATGQLAIRIAHERDTGPSLAARAAQAALDMANIPAAHLGPIFHATAAPTLTNQQHDAAYVRSALGITTSTHLALTLSAGPQGVITGLQLAARYLNQPPADGAHSALVSTGTVWSMDAATRWLGPVAYGDGGGAIVVSTERGQGKAELIATAIRTDATLGQRSYSCEPADVRAHVTNVLADVVGDVLTDADVAADRIKYLVTPFGISRPELAIGTAGGGVNANELASLITRGRNLGHLGPCDLIAGMSWLDRRPGTPAATGDHVLLLADSGGDSVGAAVFRIH